ncbi:ABC transporter permease [Planctomyces sp. SH-PL62]|uniref:ABC transporter permease n=1 Tax=Planctomyces sp. SH-PL62 TaxID=1636152 RepID=UPI00078B7441|nr:ABC transporter permease [Planctomyces sp. SH-PL62]AMV38979.1 ABC-2 family transporter protein [Planctomyces sp. SH-PL62]
MPLDLRKIQVVAGAEFSSSVRTKSFLISLLALPLIMGGSVLLQLFVGSQVDAKPRRFVVVDDAQAFAPTIAKAVESYNAQIDAAGGKIAQPRFVLEPTPALEAGGDAARALALSDRVRRGELDAYVEIVPGDGPEGSPTIQYHSNNPNDDLLRRWVTETVNAEVRARRFRVAGIDQALAERLSRPVAAENLQLADRNDAGVARKVDPVRTMAVPAILLFTVFLVVMTSGPQLLNSVIEEKMSRISEVLLGSVSPFDLMMGKLLGNAGVAMLLASLYLGAGYGVAAYHGYADVISPGLLAALVGFLFVAVLLYGSLYMAVGAACNDLKDAQSLMWPVMVLSMLPVFTWTAVLKNPASALSVGMSLFPPATPFLMLMRMAMQPSPPAWQVVLSVVLATATALACVWAGGRIFRTGLLMQGKTPSLAELAKWALKG